MPAAGSSAAQDSTPFIPPALQAQAAAAVERATAAEKKVDDLQKVLKEAALAHADALNDIAVPPPTIPIVDA